MPLIATSENNGSSFQLAPAGSFPARCVMVVDLGTQNDEYQGKPRITHKCRLGFELPTETAVFDDERGAEPFFVGKEYTLSLDPKANLRRDLECWRGKAFTEDEAKAFDLEKLIGVPCMVTIQHGKTAGGKNYAKIAGISPLPKGMKCPDQVNVKTFFAMEMGDCDAYRGLPVWIKEKIQASEEWKNTTGHQHQPETGENNVPAGQTTTPF